MKRRKAFTDITGKPLTAEDVALAVRVAVRSESITAFQIQRGGGIGVGRASKILNVLEKANVVSPKREDGTRHVILRSEPMAINAALRTLRKGNK